jgi:hypothetical protein
MNNPKATPREPIMMPAASDAESKIDNETPRHAITQIAERTALNLGSLSIRVVDLQAAVC